jgi:methionyl-tRNA synthetase
VNGAPHIGHAYTTLACDVLARFQRLMGRDVLFLTGTDEHGQKVEASAAAEGMDPQAFTDKISAEFRALADAMGYSYDQFIRTTEPRHKLAAQALWERLKERGHIYLGSYSGWYAVRDECFYTEAELIIGEDGAKKAPTGAPVAWVEEPSYFFKLSDFQKDLLDFYRDHPEFIAPNARRNEVLRFVEGGLQDLSISRTSFRWGIPVPGDEKHVMYVWLDALTNYITAAGFPDMEAMAQHWPADLHMVGKDILRFHAIFWPAFLMAADLPLPKRVVAHGWWTNEGEKISKSLGNVIDPLALVEKYGLDQVRYFLMREVSFGNDGNFSHGSMVMRMNGELANNIGNLAQRTLSQIAKNCDGKVPARQSSEDASAKLGRYAALAKVQAALEIPNFTEALEVIVHLANAANAYIDEQAPWGLKKTDPARMEAVLYELAETIRCIALLLQPFVPTSAGALLDQLAVKDRSFAALNAEHALVPGTVLPEPKAVFPRYVEPVV